MRDSNLTRILVVAGLLVLSGCSKPATTPEATTTGSTATSSSGSSTSPEAPASTGQEAAGSVPAPPSAPVPAQAAPPAPPIVVREGRTISVTVDQSISSKTSNPGDHFDASLAAPVMVGERQAIPSGARVVGIVTDAKSAGKFKGNAAITVTLDSIRVNGERYPIRTTSVTEAGKGRGKRTAIGAGGGAVVGGLIGALAGHGKGAAIGAVAGAGAGTAGAAYTGDRDITIPAETNLHFKLKDPLEIKGN